MDDHDDHVLLVGGIPTPLKNMKVSWDFYSQYMEKYKMFETTNQTSIATTMLTWVLGIPHDHWNSHIIRTTYASLLYTSGYGFEISLKIINAIVGRFPLPFSHMWMGQNLLSLYLGE